MNSFTFYQCKQLTLEQTPCMYYYALMGPGNPGSATGSSKSLKFDRTCTLFVHQHCATLLRRGKHIPLSNGFKRQLEAEDLGH